MSKHHISTCRLVSMVEKMRAKIIELGGEIRFNARPRDVYDAVHTMADILKEVGNAIAMNIYHHRDSLQSEAERLVLEAYGRKLPVVKTSFEMDFSVVAVVVSMSASASEPAVSLSLPSEVSASL